jgi:hypothetical protein
MESRLNSYHGAGLMVEDYIVESKDQALSEGVSYSAIGGLKAANPLRDFGVLAE